jgi:hypothetical protein
MQGVSIPGKAVARPEFAVGGHILGNFGGGIAGK